MLVVFSARVVEAMKAEAVCRYRRNDDINGAIVLTQPVANDVGADNLCAAGAPEQRGDQRSGLKLTNVWSLHLQQHRRTFANHTRILAVGYEESMSLKQLNAAFFRFVQAALFV